MLPTIHRNGTSRDSLLESARSAFDAIDNAINEYRATCPNGRDYYPQGPEALGLALKKHQANLKALEAIKSELMEMQEHLCS